MPNKRRKSLPGPTTPARSSEFSCINSVMDSNNYIECLVNYFKMPRDHNIPRAYWDDSMEMLFCMTYVEWRKSGEWNPNVASEANWMKLSSHLNTIWGKQYAPSIYHSKFARLKKTWRVYAKLKGLQLTSETGIGWDENRRCFMADESQWNNLQMENQDYKYFRYCQCIDKYAILSEILEGETTTGSNAHSSAVPPAQIMRQHRAHSVSSMSFSNLGDGTYVLEPDCGISQGSKLAGKRPCSSQGGTSSVQGSRGSKSSKSSDNNPFIECATSLTNYTSTKLKIRDRLEQEFEKFDVSMSTQVVESFPEVHPGRKVTALLKLQDDKWRKTFLSSSRQLQEYWLNSLEIVRQNDNGGQATQTNAGP